MAGLSATGLTIKTLSEILKEINDAQKASSILGSDWDTSTTSPQGVLNGIVSAPIAEGWQVLAAIYTQGYPAGAEGAQLDNICEFTGITRIAASESTVSVVCVGTNSTALSAGRVVSVDGQQRFASIEDATITTQSAWAALTPYAVYDLVTNDTGKLYVCTFAGTSASSGGPTGSGSTEITDGTAKWFYVATATAGVVVSFESEETGPITANAGTLTQIETAVGGWSSAFNPFDAEQGVNQETDEELRARRASSLRLQGGSSVDAMRADLLDPEQVPGVEACTVFDNDTDVTDVDGLPPHSVEVLIEGGEEQDIVDTILSTKPAGIATYGTESGVATDSSGTERTIYYSRPDSIPIYLEYDITVLETDWPAVSADGEELVKEAAVAYGDSLTAGTDVVASQFRSKAFGTVEDPIPVYDVTALRLGLSASPVGTSNITIGSRERATFDTSRVVVNVTVI